MSPHSAPPSPHHVLLRRAGRLAVALACLLPAVAVASGGGDDIDPYGNTPDIALMRFQRGALGVLMPFDRVYLYAAWRAITLGPAIAKAPNLEGGLKRAAGNLAAGWIDQKALKKAASLWHQSVAAALNQAAPPASTFWLGCPASSYSFATTTLDGLAARADATPARLGNWIANQRQVFAACGDAADGAASDDEARAQAEKAALAAPVAPAITSPLSAAGPVYWQQQQQYQMAALAFHQRDYGAAGTLFDTIGATAGHPQQRWGAYLALRAAVRDATSNDREDSAEDDVANRATLDELQRQADKITADPALGALHDAARATLRTAAFNLAPHQLLENISHALDDANADPYRDDRLGDWRRFANRYFENGETALLQTMRRQHDYLDWVSAVQACAYRERSPACAAERAHALEQWSRYDKEKNPAAARTWLVAALMLNDQWSPALQQAALAVPAAAPEYLTVRYRLARFYRLSGQAAKARGIADPVLASARLKELGSSSTGNLFLQERFSSATSLHDAAAYLMRSASILHDADTGEVADPDPAAARVRVEGDGLSWLNGHLALADLMQLAHDEQLSAKLRANIAVAVWLRAELLDLPAVAATAAQLSAQLAPELAPVAQRYRAFGDARRRRYWLLMQTKVKRLAPVVDGAAWPQPFASGSGWCGIGDPAPAADATPDNEAPSGTTLPEVSTDKAGRDQQLAGLKKAGYYDALIAEQVLWRAASAPQDPDLPRLLHEVVASSHNACAANNALFKQAFQLLHKRYPRDAWTKKTPYYY